MAPPLGLYLYTYSFGVKTHYRGAKLGKKKNIFLKVHFVLFWGLFIYSFNVLKNT
jgi:hypothetical protein